MIKTFRFVRMHDPTDHIRLIWDNEKIYIYAKDGCIELLYHCFIDRDVCFLTDYRYDGTNVYYRPASSINSDFKCLINHNLKLYKPDTLKTKKRFLKHVDLIKTTK